MACSRASWIGQTQQIVTPIPLEPSIRPPRSAHLHQNAALQQQPDQLDVLVLDGRNQRRPVQRVHAVDVQLVRAVLEVDDQAADAGAVAALGQQQELLLGGRQRVRVVVVERIVLLLGGVQRRVGAIFVVARHQILLGFGLHGRGRGSGATGAATV